MVSQRVLYCPTNKHKMLRVARELWLCECSATGEMTILKGAVEEARAMVAREGGFVAIQQRMTEKNRERRKKLAKERREKQAQLGKFGYYRAWTIDDWYAL